MCAQVCLSYVGLILLLDNCLATWQDGKKGGLQERSPAELLAYRREHREVNEVCALAMHSPV